MRISKAFQQIVALATVLFIATMPAFAQMMETLQLAELKTKLQLNEQQEKAMAPIVAQRDKQVKALKGDTSMPKLQKLRKAEAIQKNFRDQAAKVLTPEQTKKLEALQAERRSKLIGG